MKKQSTYMRVYGLCVDGFPAIKICRIVRRDKGTVSRIINALIDGGFLVCINPRDKVRFYEPTKKMFTPDDEKLCATIQQEKPRKMRQAGSFIRCHGLSFRADIISFKKYIKWDKEWQSKGCHHSLFYYPFAGLGSVSFHRIKSKSCDVLRINLPNIRWNVNREESVQQYIGNISQKVLRWFCDRYGVSILNIRKCDGDSAGLAVRDRELMRLAQKRTVRFDDGFMLDASPPDNTPEFEGPISLMAELLKCPEEIRKLKAEMKVIKDGVADVADGLSDLKKELKETRKEIQELIELFRKPNKPDTFEDVT